MGRALTGAPLKKATNTIMRKLLLSAFALLLAVTASAQGFTAKKFDGTLGVQKAATVQSTVKKAPAKADIASNQRLLGQYSGSECDAYLGVTNFPGNNKIAISLESEDLAPYIGSKVVGVRFNLGQGCSASSVFVKNSVGENLYDLVEKEQNITSPSGAKNTGTWHVVMFDADKQFTLTEEYSELLVGFSYTQTSDNYPFGSYSGAEAKDFYIYCNIPASSGGSGLNWYGFQSPNGALCIQLILENDNFPKNALAPLTIGRYTTALGKSRNIVVKATNIGGTASNLDYTITLDGVTGAEKHIDLGKSYATGDIVELNVPVEAAATTGEHPMKFTITKVNGAINEYANNTAEGTNITLAKEFKKVSVVEECTGTGCGWCPRGHAAMHAVSEQYGDNVICMAAHMYNSTDPMYVSRYYYSMTEFGGAPTCIVNRNTDIVDPYYDMPTLLAQSYADLPVAAVSVSGMFSADNTQVNATASVESLVSGTSYDLAYVLLADGLEGSTNAWKQGNYYYQYRSQKDQFPEDLQYYCDQPSSVAMTFNDVIIAHSYSSKTNNAKFSDLVEGSTTNSSYTLTMPTKTTLKNAIDFDKVYVVAVLTDKTTGAIINAAKAKVELNPTAIETVNTSSEATVVARFAADGTQLSAPQKGINILKMSDGTTRKVLVK